MLAETLPVNYGPISNFFSSTNVFNGSEFYMANFAKEDEESCDLSRYRGS